MSQQAPVGFITIDILEARALTRAGQRREVAPVCTVVLESQVSTTAPARTLGGGAWRWGERMRFEVRQPFASLHVTLEDALPRKRRALHGAEGVLLRRMEVAC